MLVIPSKQKERIDNLMGQVVFGFNTAKLDGIQQIKNATAVVVRSTVPNIPPPQTGWIWVDTVGGKSYISTGTTAVGDRSLLGTIGGSVASGKVAVGNSGGLTSYTSLGYTNATGVLSSPILNAETQIRVDGTKILGSQGSAVADASGGSNIDTEARTAINNLLSRLRSHGIIAT